MAELFKLAPPKPKIARRSVQPGGPHILIIVQNLPVPLDRRVWLECQTLIAAGYEVSVICPKGPGDPGRQVIDGVSIYKYRPAPDAEGIAGFVVEFAYSWMRTALLSLVVWGRRPFHLIQACNPPDTYWLLARLWRVRQVGFVFDQHDLNPELYLSRFGKPTSAGGKLQLGGLRWLEQMTYRTATAVISTNESYRSVAMGRGRRHPDDVTVVRSGPDTRVMRPVHPAEPGAKATKTLVYLGIMGPQDGVDVVLQVMADLVHRRGRRDVRATLMGFGDCLADLRALATELDLDDWVTFTGRADRDVIADELSAADIGLCPDLKSPLNDVSTMNKTMEYMAYALPSVAFDLVETRVSGGAAVTYVPSGDVVAFTDAVERLLDDDDLRREMGMFARERVVTELDWRQQAVKYVGVFDRLTGSELARLPVAAVVSDPDGRPDPGVDHRGRRYVDLDDRAEFEHFVVTRQGRPAEVAEPVAERVVLGPSGFERVRGTGGLIDPEVVERSIQAEQALG